MFPAAEIEDTVFWWFSNAQHWFLLRDAMGSTVFAVVRCHGHLDTWTPGRCPGHRDGVPVSWLQLAAATCLSRLVVTWSGRVTMFGCLAWHLRRTLYSLDRHVSNVCKSCFFWLLQLRRVCRSLDIESVKTQVRAFVTSRVDYCNSVMALSPMTITDKLQWVLISAARLITATEIGRASCRERV